MSISLIACIDLNNSIGYNGSLLTKPPLDLKQFKSITEGGFVVFGRNTFKEIGKPLSNRTNIVLSSKKNIKLPSGIHHYESVDDILFEYENYANKDVKMFICGGEKVYSEFLPYADFIYLTIVDHYFTNTDRYFPKFPLEEWKVIESVKNNSDEKYAYDYYFIKYERRKKINF